MHAMAIPLCCFRGEEWRSWAFAGNEPSLVETHIDFARTTLLGRLKSEVRSRRRFYDNWAARGTLSTTSPDAIKDGIIFGWSLQRALHPPLAEAEQHPTYSFPHPHYLHILHLLAFASHRRASPPSTKCNPRKASRAGSAIIFSRQIFPGFTLDREPRLIAKSEITYLLFSGMTKSDKSEDGTTPSLKTHRLSILRDYYLIHC